MALSPHDDTLPAPAAEPSAEDVEGLETAAVRQAARRKLFGEAVVDTAPPKLDRYVILEAVGAGGMGQVFAAYDPELDRKIAIKLVRQERAGSTQGRARLLREAQAMARLDHPNVVAVHDVGMVDEQVFIAMEFVEGGTLTRWLSKPRPLRETLALLLDCGRGLAAAHAAGVVHRDFKPDNVLTSFDQDGKPRARVTDFGLARAVASKDDEGRSTPAADQDVDLTLTGVVMGTPAYMAPEQHRGEEVGPAADQFAFCLVICEALTGKRPFREESYPSYARKVMSGRFDEPEALQGLPRHIRAAVKRGLARRPEDRWPSLSDLLRALQHDPKRTWRRFGTLAVVAATGIGAWTWRRDPSELCTVPRSRLGDAWSSARRQAVAQALRATGMGYGETLAVRVVEAIDAWSDAWIGQRTEACMATHVRGEQSATLLDLRMACLDRKLVELEALSRVLSETDASNVRDAAGALDALPDLEDCADTVALQHPFDPPTEDQSESVDIIRADIAMAEAFKVAGRYASGVELARDLATRARTLGYAPVLAEALLVQGRLEQRAGNPEAAEPILEDAALIAEALGHDVVVLGARIELCWVVGTQLGRLNDAVRWGRFAEALLKRRGQTEMRAAAELHSTMQAVYGAHRRLEDARREQMAAIALTRRLEGTESVGYAADLHNLALIEKDSGNLEEAQEYFERARAIFEREYGTDHPDTLNVINGLALVAYHRGDHASASALHRVALEGFERTLGPAHSYSIAARNGLANAAERAGNLAEAEAHHRTNLARLEEGLGDQSPQAASIHINLGNVLFAKKDFAAALAEHRRAQSMIETLFGADHPVLAYALAGEGRSLLELGDPAAAHEALEHAWTLIGEGTEGDPLLRGQVALALGPLLWDRGSRPRAVEVMRSAREAFERSGTATDAERRAVTEWLEAHADEF